MPEEKTLIYSDPTLVTLRDAAELVLASPSCADPDCCILAATHQAALGELRKAVHNAYPPEARFESGADMPYEG